MAFKIEQRTKKQLKRNKLLILLVIGNIIILLLTAVPFQLNGSVVARVDQNSLLDFLSDSSVNRYMSGLEINDKIVLMNDHGGVISFYSMFTKNPEITRTILEESLRLKIPVNIAFALAWKESRFNPRAISPQNRRGTRDWGLFQLNDGGRKNWGENDFFDIRKNTYSALFYLKHCIDKMGNLSLGLAAYNAGIYGVSTGGVPAATGEYVKSILSFEEKLNRGFNECF